MKNALSIPQSYICRKRILMLKALYVCNDCARCIHPKKGMGGSDTAQFNNTSSVDLRLPKNEKFSISCTAYFHRTTAIRGMIAGGFKIRHVKHMPGHKNESSDRSYKRECSAV